MDDVDYTGIDFSDFRESLEWRVLQTPAINRSDASTVAVRTAFCASCPHSVTMFRGVEVVKDVKMCDFCGCVTELKARLKNSDCPLNNW